MLRNTVHRALVLGLVAAMASIGIAAATPGSGAAGTILSVGTLPAGVKLKTPALKLSTRDDVQVVTQTIKIVPGGHTGWHSHPGPVIVTIAAGTMTFYDADDPTCSAGTYATGDSFVDRGGGHVHIARNEGTVDLVLYATYLIPVGAGIRTDIPNPGTCPF
ncbi:MAG: cupin domain-containing protein [Candidatus Limnocylindrales bacterium]